MAGPAAGQAAGFPAPLPGAFVFRASAGLRCSPTRSTPSPFSPSCLPPQARTALPAPLPLPAAWRARGRCMWWQTLTAPSTCCPRPWRRLPPRKRRPQRRLRRSRWVAVVAGGGWSLGGGGCRGRCRQVCGGLPLTMLTPNAPCPRPPLLASPALFWLPAGLLTPHTCVPSPAAADGRAEGSGGAVLCAAPAVRLHPHVPALRGGAAQAGHRPRCQGGEGGAGAGVLLWLFDGWARFCGDIGDVFVSGTGKAAVAAPALLL